MEEIDGRIDSTALQRVMRMGGPSLLGRLVAAAFGNLETRRGELAAALAAGDGAAAERAAHSIKSSARNVGADALGDAAAVAEELARTGEEGWRAAAAMLLAADLTALRAAVTAAAAGLEGPGGGSGENGGGGG
jgi:HPt (histidine-containing phosphotransfer) domain-containing protein